MPFFMRKRYTNTDACHLCYSEFEVVINWLVLGRIYVSLFSCIIFELQTNMLMKCQFYGE